MKIVITRCRGRMLALGLEGNVCELALCLPDEQVVGNVYVGKVREVVKNINACFVSVTEDVKCYLDISDCTDGVLPGCGDEIAVKVKAAAVRQKLPACTMKVKKELRELAKTRRIYSCLERAPLPYIKRINNLQDGEIDAIITDNAKIYDELKDGLPELFEDNRIRLYEDDYPLSKLFSVNERLSELLAKRVWMKSGGYLVIEHTEALHVIDVNTGRFDRRRDKAATVHEINLEAATEAARQIRLRNLSGIILIDFINYEGEADERVSGLKERLAEGFAADIMKPRLIDITPLYLAEITRRKKDPPLYELFDHGF